MNIFKTIRKLCTPAYVYLVMSTISIIIIMLQNSGNETSFCIGSYTCRVASVSFVFIAQALYTALWTFILDYVCSKGYSNISWFLILIPYLLFFVIIGIMILTDKNKEGLLSLSTHAKATTGGYCSPHKKVDCKKLSSNACGPKAECAMTAWGCENKNKNCHTGNNGKLCSGNGTCSVISESDARQNDEVGAPECECVCQCDWSGPTCKNKASATQKKNCHAKAAAAKKKT